MRPVSCEMCPVTARVDCEAKLDFALIPLEAVSHYVWCYMQTSINGSQLY